MISGACLLGKRDSYAKTGRRILRTLLALVLASYLYFLWDAWVNYGLWPRAVDFGALFGKIWRGEITDGFWYLPLYLGLLLTLPLWQRMASAMEKRDYEYLMALTFTVGAAWPLLSHYVPVLALPKYLDQLIPCAYLGLFFAGHYLVKYREPRRNSVLLAAVSLALSLAVCWALTRLEFDRVEPGRMYWFMDERTAPALPVIAASLSLFWLARCIFGSCRSGRLLTELGGCAFGMYLLQDLLIAESKNRLFLPLCEKAASVRGGTLLGGCRVRRRAGGCMAPAAHPRHETHLVIAVNRGILKVAFSQRRDVCPRAENDRHKPAQNGQTFFGKFWAVSFSKR